MNDRSFFAIPRLVHALFTEMWSASHYGWVPHHFLLAPRASAGWSRHGHRGGDLRRLHLAGLPESVPGGWLADRLRIRAPCYGSLIAAGHFTLAVPAATLYMACVDHSGHRPARQTSASMSAPVCQGRPAAGCRFRVLHGHQPGALLGPLVTGYLAQQESFRTMVVGWASIRIRRGTQRSARAPVRRWSRAVPAGSPSWHGRHQPRRADRAKASQAQAARSGFSRRRRRIRGRHAHGALKSTSR